MDSKKPLYKSIPFWIVVLILLYSALGFFAIPYIAKKTAKEISLDKLNSTLSLNDLNFNPFTFTSTLKGISLTDKDKTLWFSADKIEVNFNLWNSLVNNASIEELSINNPFYKIVTENSNNETTIKYPKLGQTNEVKAVEEKFVLDVHTIAISKGAIQYNDQSGSKQFNLNLKELNFNQQLFTTKNSESHFDLSVKTENDDETFLSGSFNFAQLSVDAKWQLQNWKTTTIFTFIGDDDNQFLGLKNKSGLINAQGNLVYKGLEKQTSQVNIKHLNLISFENNYGDKQQLNLDQVVIKDATIDLLNQQIKLQEVSTDGGLLDLSFDKNNALIGSALLTSNETPTKANATSKSWAFQINKLNNRQFTLGISKQKKDAQWHNTVEIKNLAINNISSNHNQEMGVNAEIIVDNVGNLTLQSTLVIEPLRVKAQVNAQQVDLSKFSAWIPDNVKLRINKGSLSLQQEVIYDGYLASQGRIKVKELELLDQTKLPFLQLNQLDLEQFILDEKNKTIKLNRVMLDQAQGSLMLSEDKQLNLSHLIDKQTDNNANKNTADDWKIEIKEIKLKDAQTSFIDKSIKPQYQTELSKLNGHIKGLSSSNLAKAQVELSGVLDSYGKITINGKINPLSEKAYTDLAINIKNLDLQNFNSYSSQYLGFPIKRGKADFNLHYKLNQDVLKGVNDLTFKQLKFGNKTASKDAVNLPLKLAVSLLTDGKGMMKINLPVRGNINDPDFSYGGLVFKAFFKLITGIVASPFKLLGKLIPGGADLDLSGVQFQAGTALLQTGEEEKLKAMQQILAKKPELNLELTAIIHNKNDGDALRTKKALQLAGFESTPDFGDNTQLPAIKQLYEKLNLPKSWQQLRDEFTVQGEVHINNLLQKAWNEIIKKQEVSTDLLQLAKQRALFVQEQLIEKYGVEQDKIFLKGSENSQQLPPQVKFGVAQ